MERAGEICGMALGGGVIVGGCTGFAVGVWVLAALIQPALAATQLSSSQASGITAIIALFGVIEVFTVAGAVAGAAAAPIATGIIGCIGSRLSFFCSKKDIAVHPEARAEAVHTV